MSHPGTVPVRLDATGSGSADIAHNLNSLYWRIHQVSVGAGSSARTITVQVLINGFPCTSQCTGAPPLTASGPPPIDIGGHDKLTVVVTNGPANDSLPVSYFYEEIQGAP